jgi:hypothetical protein
MTARETTQNALAAIAAGNMDALSGALAARETSLRSASRSEQADALRDGEALALSLAEFRRTLATEHAHLEQWRRGLAGYYGSSFSGCIDLHA